MDNKTTMRKPHTDSGFVVLPVSPPSTVVVSVSEPSSVVVPPGLVDGSVTEPSSVVVSTGLVGSVKRSSMSNFICSAKDKNMPFGKRLLAPTIWRPWQVLWAKTSVENLE